MQYNKCIDNKHSSKSRNDC